MVRDIEGSLQQTANEWINRLKLNDWRIIIEDNMNPWDMSGDSITKRGCVSYDESTKEAVIYLLDPECMPAENDFGYDKERTLVHELLHIKMSLLQTDDDSTLQDRIVHQIIDELAYAFVDAKRMDANEEKDISGPDPDPDNTTDSNRYTSFNLMAWKNGK